MGQGTYSSNSCHLEHNFDTTRPQSQWICYLVLVMMENNMYIDLSCIIPYMLLIRISLLNPILGILGCGETIILHL